MAQWVFRIFLTFVVVKFFIFSTISYAKPDRSLPEDVNELKSSLSREGRVEDLSDERVQEDTGNLPLDSEMSGLKVTPVPEPRNFSEYSQQFSRAHYFHGYKKALTLRAGAVFGFEDSSDDPDSTNGLLGFAFLFPRKRSPQIEASADLSFVGDGHLSVLSRHIFNERSSFRPYYRWGLMHKLDPDERLASFSDFENYLARFGFGFENSIRPARSFRIEVELAAGAKDVLGFLTLGHVFSL